MRLGIAMVAVWLAVSATAVVGWLPVKVLKDWLGHFFHPEAVG